MLEKSGENKIKYIRVTEESTERLHSISLILFSDDMSTQTVSTISLSSVLDRVFQYHMI